MVEIEYAEHRLLCGVCQAVDVAPGDACIGCDWTADPDADEGELACYRENWLEEEYEHRLVLSSLPEANLSIQWQVEDDDAFLQGDVIANILWFVGGHGRADEQIHSQVRACRNGSEVRRVVSEGAFVSRGLTIGYYTASGQPRSNELHALCAPRPQSAALRASLLPTFHIREGESIYRGQLLADLAAPNSSGAPLHSIRAIEDGIALKLYPRLIEADTSCRHVVAYLPV